VSVGTSHEIAAAAALLKAGGVVAFPTETVYGLGAEVSHPAAVKRVFDIKRRPYGHPLIVHIADSSKLQYWAEEIPQQAWQLADRFWPGPLTLILPHSKHVGKNITGGQDTVGLRVPAHSVALELLNALGPEQALAAPSANRFGRISPTTAAHVREELGEAVDMVLDGGPCEVGLESTIVGFEDSHSRGGSRAVILRPGGISMTELEEVLGCKITSEAEAQSGPRVPGALASHYAPATPLELCSGKHLYGRALELEKRGLRIAVLTWSLQTDKQMKKASNENIVYIPMVRAPEIYARLLYGTLRQLDHEGFDSLLVEETPDEPQWVAIADRLRRASCINTDKNMEKGVLHG
jgi:L-threonylcarbamoyladenylate synthase